MSLSLSEFPDGTRPGLGLEYVSYWTVTDRGRMAYIDSELAKRRAVEGAHAVPSDSASGIAATAVAMSAAISAQSAPGTTLPSHARNKDPTQRQPATIGKLQEIDLGDEARNRNIERTNNARRRMDGEIVEEVVQGGKKKKVRLNRDGSVWVPRKRRGSEDIKRDQLVEAVLRENRCRFSCSLPTILSQIKDASYWPIANYLSKWKSTRSLHPSQRGSMMIKPQTTGSQRSSGGTSWIRCLRDRGRKRHLRSRLLEGLVVRRKRSL